MAGESCVDSIESVESGIFLGVREVRRVYLITYSQADTTKVPSREKFSDIVLQAFQQREVHNAQCAVEHWSCCLEYHRDGGVHFHMAIKLTRPKRWLAVRQLIHARYGINVHFSNRHVNYYSAWTYVRLQTGYRGTTFARTPRSLEFGATSNNCCLPSCCGST